MLKLAANWSLARKFRLPNLVEDLMMFFRVLEDPLTERQTADGLQEEKYQT